MPLTNFGQELYAIIAEQTAWGTQAEISNVERTIFEIVRSTLRAPELENLRPGQIPNMIRVDGNLEFFIHSTKMGLWLRHLMMADSVTSTLINGESYRHDLRPSNNVLEGLTIEVVEEETPNTFDSLLVTQGVLDFTDRITMSLSFLGRNADPGYSIGGIEGISTDVSSFDRLSVQDAESWEVTIEINGEVYPVFDAKLAVNHNLDFPATQYAGTIYYPKPGRQDNREITLSAMIEGTLNNLDATFRPEVTAKLVMVTQPSSTASLNFTFPQAELVEYTNFKALNRIEIRPFGSAGNDEMALTIVNSERSI